MVRSRPTRDTPHEDAPSENESEDELPPAPPVDPRQPHIQLLKLK